MNCKKFTLAVLSLLVLTSSTLLSTRPVYGNSSSAPHGDSRSIPFKGSFNGSDSDIGFTDTSVNVQTVGIGRSTIIGRFSFVQVVTVNFDDLTDTGVAQWVAADGDTIDISIAGFGVPEITSDGLIFNITETDTIVGGTGRFAGAEGSFTVQRVASPDTFLTSGSFAGNLRY